MGYRMFMIWALMIMAGCRSGFDGDPTANQAPETFMMVDTIQRTGVDRFSSQVKIYWWGTDPDGYLKGFEISTDGVHWNFTTKQDSLIKFTLPTGKDSFDFRFQVRAVDHLGLSDPSPAILGVPVKNASPEISFITPGANPGITTRFPVRSFPVLKYNLTANDLDGISDIARIEIVWNDTAAIPFVLPPKTTELTLMADQPKASASACKIFTGSNLSPVSGLMSGMLLDASNILYARAIDQVGSRSPWMPAPAVFVRKVKGDILLVNAYTSITAKLQAQAYYAGALKDLGKVADTLQLTEISQGNYTELSPDNQTQDLVFRLFKHIVWFSDEGNFSLSFAQKTLLGFFNQGGNMFMSCAFNSSFDTSAGFLNITPVQRLVPQPAGQTFRMVNGYPLTAMESGWPALQCNASPFLVRPVFSASNSGSIQHEYLYRAKIRITGSVNADWESNDSTQVAIRRKLAGGKTQYIFFSVPLEKMNGLNNSALFFKKAWVDELEF